MHKHLFLLALLVTLGIFACQKDQTENDQPFENTHWRLQKRIQNNVIEIIPENIVVTAAFIAGKVSGSGGCNEYQAAYLTIDDQISVEPITSTLKLCAGSGGLEATYYNDLEASQSWEVNGSTLKVQTADALLVFKAE